MRLPKDHLNTGKEQSLSKHSDQAENRSVMQGCDESPNRCQIDMYEYLPWKQTGMEIFINMPFIIDREDPGPQKKPSPVAWLDSFNADFTVYTDGSASAGCTKGGEAAVVTRGTAENPVVLKELKTKGAAFISSYKEELSAATMAVE